jgi:hypothetical protein
MAKVGTKPKPKKPKTTSDKEQSERFIETARRLRIEEAADQFEKVFKKIVPPKEAGR